MTHRIKLEPRAAPRSRPHGTGGSTTDLLRRPLLSMRNSTGRSTMIKTTPQAGQPLNDPDEPEQRRIFLSRVRYHLYYRMTDDAVEVRAFWHASRGTGPDL